MTASTWDLGKLFLSIPVIISIGIGFLLALCFYVDSLLDLDDIVPEMAEVPTGNQTPTLPAPMKDSGKYTRDTSEQVELEVEEDGRKSSITPPEQEKVEEVEEEGQQLSMIALIPLYSWLMEICEKEERSTSNSTILWGARAPGHKVSANPAENSGSSAEMAACSTCAKELPRAMVSSGNSRNGCKSSGIGSSSTDHKVSAEADGRSTRKEEHTDPNRGSLVMETTEGKIGANDDIGEIPVPRTKTCGSGCRGCDAKASEVSGCRQCDVRDRECRQCDVYDADISGCRQCDARNSGYRQCEACTDVDGSGCACSGLQQQQLAVCYENDWMWEYFRLLNELEMERGLTEGLTLQLARKTLDLQLVQERNCYLEDCLKRVVMREAAAPLSCGTKPVGPGCDGCWNCGQRNSGMGPRGCCIPVERAAETGKDPKQVAQSCARMERVDDCQAEKLGRQMQHVQCGTEYKRCQVESGRLGTERCRTEQENCKKDRGICHNMKIHPCQTEQGQCQMEQKRCQVEKQCQMVQRQCCIEQGLCQTEQKWCQIKHEKCQMDRGRCQLEQIGCYAEQGHYQMERGQCQIEPGRCHMEQKQCLMQPKVVQTEHSSHEMEPSQRQQEQKLIKKEPRCEKEPWKSGENRRDCHLEHLASAETIPKEAMKNDHDGISHDDQTNRIRNPRVEASPDGFIFTTCASSHSSDCPRTSGLACNRMERGTCNPYDSHDRAGLFPDHPLERCSCCGNRES